MDAVNERVTVLERQVEALTAMLVGILMPGTSNINTPGNITQVDPGRTASDPVKQFMGNSPDSGLYTFWQRRFSSGDGQYWGGMETFRRPAAECPPHWGYGAEPMRLWGQNFLFEANGTAVVRNIVTERVYLAPPVFRNLETGEFVPAASFDANGTPYGPGGERLGGIYWDTANLGVYLTQVDGWPVVVKGGITYRILALDVNPLGDEQLPVVP
jgi:hypothetical protein